MSISSIGGTHWEKSDGCAARAAYSAKEVAEMLGVSEASIWRALKRGDFEAVMLGNRRLILARSVKKLLATAG